MSEADVFADRTAWDVFIRYGGIYQLAKALAGTGVTTLSRVDRTS